MNTHQPSRNPIILINFDTVIYKDGAEFLHKKNETNSAPQLKKKLKIFLKSLCTNFRLIIYTKKHFHEALHWIVTNNLHENCIHRLTRRKPRHSFYIAEL